MLPSRRRGHARRALFVVVLAAILGIPALDPTTPAGADQSPEVTSAVDGYQAARADLAAAEATRRGAASERDAAAAARDEAAADLDDADATLNNQRRRYAALSSEYYVIQGADDEVVNDSMYLALSGRRQRLDRAK